MKYFVCFFLPFLWGCHPIERTNMVRVVTLTYLQESNSLVASGEFIDVKKGKNVANHGFLVGINDSSPTIDISVLDSVGLGVPASESTIFRDTIPALLFNTDYYIRPYMLVDQTVVYGIAKKYTTGSPRPIDIPVALTSVTLTLTQVQVNGFISRTKLEQTPLTITGYGSIINTAIDSLNATTITEPFNTAQTGVISFFHTHTSPPMPGILKKIFVWGFVDYYLNNEPTNIRRIYTPRKEVDFF